MKRAAATATADQARSGDTLARAAWLFADAALLVVASIAAQWLVDRALVGSGEPPTPHWVGLALAAAYVVAAQLADGGRGRQAGAAGLLRTIVSILTVAAVIIILETFFRLPMPGFRTIAAVAAVFGSVALAMPRLVADAMRERMRGAGAGMRTLVLGTGEAAERLTHWLKHRPKPAFDVVGFVRLGDAERDSVDGRVLGSFADLPRLVAEYGAACVIVAHASAPQRLISEVVSLTAKAAALGHRPPVVKVMPDLDELLTGKGQALRVRDVGIDDLVPREPVKVDLSSVAPHLSKRTILVTGAGGSIGSELCRQIARFDVDSLVLVDQSENVLFDIEQELRETGFTRTTIALGDVCDAARIRKIFTDHRPHVVFHAAAHKHVPILEGNALEAVANNIFGTHVIALSAAAAGVAKFVFVSTDKAVKPTSILGVTKRVAEQICQSFEGRTGTEFVVVRFGNVLDSSGSVLPIFRRQIERGGPVTVTHPEMQRYFMSISEAVSLVLAAMAIGRDGQVVVMDMGKPVKILDLAEKLIMLAGFVPHEEIQITYIGPRPGEKLYEEVLTASEDLTTTAHERLFIAQQERVEYDRLAEPLARLNLAVRAADIGVAIDLLKELVPSYQPGRHFAPDTAGEDAAGERATPTITTIYPNGSAARRTEADGQAAAADHARD